MKVRSIGFVLAGMASLLICAAAAAQEKQAPPKEESVAAAARRVQAQKRPASKAGREFTNDNLPAGGRVAIIGEESVAPGSDAEAARPAPSAESEKERSQADSELAAEKAKLENLKKQLDVAERQLKLDNAQLYSNPQTAASDTGGRGNLANQQEEIAGKKAAITESEARIAELTEKARAVSERLGPKAEEPKTPEQVRDSWGSKLGPLRDELARVDSELSGMRAAGGSGGLTGFAAERAQGLEQRRAELQRQISAVEEDARRAGSLPPQ